MIKRSILLGALAAAITWSGAADATPDFPGVVVHTLDLPAVTIDPPQGCELCHTTDSGGTSLRTFGALLQQYGTQPYQESTLTAALGQVAQNEPQLIADIKAGRDPNDDTGTTDVHTPEYGCRGASITGTGAGSPIGWSALLMVALRSARSRSRRRRRP